MLERKRTASPEARRSQTPCSPSYGETHMAYAVAVTNPLAPSFLYQTPQALVPNGLLLSSVAFAPRVSVLRPFVRCACLHA
jgi:hypothetical protein